MASLETPFDIKDLMDKKVTLQVRLKRSTEYYWRVRLALLLCRLASKIAQFSFELIIEKPLSPWLYYCKRCGRDIAGYKPDFAQYLVVGCPYCYYQSLVIGDEGSFTYIEPETLDMYVCECHFAEPYGFVPEADCPIHDRTWK